MKHLGTNIVTATARHNLTAIVPSSGSLPGIVSTQGPGASGVPKDCLDQTRHEPLTSMPSKKTEEAGGEGRGERGGGGGGGGGRKKICNGFTPVPPVCRTTLAAWCRDRKWVMRNGGA